MEKVRVLVWNENIHERKSEAIRKIYPIGIHGAIAEGLEQYEEFEVRTATMDMPEYGLDEETLKSTDVLIWWSHIDHDGIPEEIAERVKQKVLDGMGLIALHSSQRSKPFMKLMGTRCRVKWRENDEKERIWVVEPAHPIARNLPEFIEIQEEETYGERFDIPTPDELVFISWFAGGEVFRSGCCWKRGLGKVFYFRPGHEEYPIYYRDDIRQILANAVDWAKPSHGPKPTTGNVKKPYEDLRVVDHSDEFHP